MKRAFFQAAVCAALLLAACGAYGQTVEAELGRRVEFVPRGATALEQLVEVAKRFRIPMGIEWQRPAEEAAGRGDADPAGPWEGSLRDLIQDILLKAPGHEMRVEDGVVHIFPSAAVSHPFNFLNIEIDSFHVRGAHLFDAEAHLRTMINLTLYPELFKNGYGGGHGHTPGHVFTVKNISVSGHDLTIRQVLNRIAAANGNALWVVELGADELAGAEPFWVGKELNEYGHSPVNARWRFAPLAEIEELAKEEVVVELADAEGCLSGRKVVIAVVPEHGLSEGQGGNTQVSSSAGFSCGYSVTASEVKKDEVRLSVELNLKPARGPQTKISESITVRRGAAKEVSFDGGITLRARLRKRLPDPGHSGHVF